jgi:hypothetical protein
VGVSHFHIQVDSSDNTFCAAAAFSVIRFSKSIRACSVSLALFPNNTDNQFRINHLALQVDLL